MTLVNCTLRELGEQAQMKEVFGEYLMHTALVVYRG